MATTIRQAGPAEIPLLRELATAIWHEAYADLISHEQIRYMLHKMYAPDVVAAEMQKGIVWDIISCDGRDCGFISYGPDGGTGLKLSKIYLDAASRGSGVAAIALRHVISSARALHKSSVWLTVNKQNSRAIRAYEKNGFRTAEAAVFDVGGGFVMDDYIMRLDL